MSKEKKTEKAPGAFDATLSAIKTASQALNRAADEASLEIEALEQQLSEIEPGVSVWTRRVASGAHLRRRSWREKRLAFRAVGLPQRQKGGLVVRDDVIAPDGTVLQQEEVPLRKAERETRLLLRSHLPEVLNLVLNTLTVQVGRLPAPVIPESEALSA